MKEETTLMLMPKGIIVGSLGGYIKGKDQADIIADDLIKFMEEHKVAIIVNNGYLDFMPYIISDTKAI